MTPAAFRRLALKLPDAVESSHHDHPDFRIGGKIFATLSPEGKGYGMVKLSREEQEAFIAARPATFSAFNGAWGRAGCTKVILKSALVAAVDAALSAAWRNVSRTGGAKRSGRKSGSSVAKRKSTPRST
jgi:hypothetical protein